jgi:hypothetical protein
MMYSNAKDYFYDDSNQSDFLEIFSRQIADLGDYKIPLEKIEKYSDDI